jgi:hypothetical protein
MDVGTLADWVGALGGLLAVSAAYGSWKTSEKVVKLEHKRDREREAESERRQAEHVAVVGVLRPDAPKEEQFAILVVNGSGAPIYDICIESQKADKSRDNPRLKLAVLPPGKFVIPTDRKYIWGDVIDQDVAHMKLNMMAKGNAGEMITHVTFTDASSRRWQLQNGRVLKPVEPNAE